MDLFAGQQIRRAAPRGKRAAALISTPTEGGKTVDGEMIMCVHCGRHWLYHKGSGQLRGWCGNCAGFTCGPCCPAGDNCVPVEQLLANLEAGLPFHEAARHRPIAVSRGGILMPGE